MLLRLDLNVADDAGNPVRSCTILKCHKQEGDRVDCGDPLFDIEVSELLIPPRLGSAWADSNFFNTHPSEIADLSARPEHKAATDRVAPEDSDFVFHKTAYRQIVAVEPGTVHTMFTAEGSPQKLGDPLAIFATDDRDSPDTNSGSAAPAYRAASRNLGLDRALDGRRSIMHAKSTRSRQYVSGGSIMFWSAQQREQRIGIFARGGCDLPSIKACWPMIERILRGTCCITHEGVIADARSDLLLQTLRDDLPQETIDEVLSKLNLNRSYFEPRVFGRNFTVDGPDGLEEFPINVVILGSGSDLVRTVYRHRRHNLLVDPGTAWLDHVEDALKDLSAVAWFRRNFESIGRITPEQYRDNMMQVVREIRKRSTAHVLIFNNLTVEPRGTNHNYQFMSSPESVRRLEFKLALVDVSRSEGVHVIDVDRIAKNCGIHTMLDISHFPAKITMRIAEEIFGILQDLRVF